MAFVFNKCCGCIALRTGCLIIGYINTIICVITLALLALAGVLVKEQADSVEDKVDKDEFAFVLTAALIIAIVTAVVLALFLIFNIVLLVGIYKNKRGHVKAYLIFSVIILVIYLILVCLGFAGTTNIQSVISKLVSILINIYFLLVVRSYYYLMGDNQQARYTA